MNNASMDIVPFNNPFSVLPSELFENICKQECSLKDIWSLSQSCRSLNQLCVLPIKNKLNNVQVWLAGPNSVLLDISGKCIKIWGGWRLSNSSSNLLLDKGPSFLPYCGPNCCLFFRDHIDRKFAIHTDDENNVQVDQLNKYQVSLEEAELKKTKNEIKIVNRVIEEIERREWP